MQDSPGQWVKDKMIDASNAPQARIAAPSKDWIVFISPFPAKIGYP
jgi:hypothetical protein